MSSAEIFLIDGPLVSDRRRDLVQRMAKDLNRFDSWQNEQDAIRSLFGYGYSIIDIALLLDDARQVAFQMTVDVVAREVGKP